MFGTHLISSGRKFQSEAAAVSINLFPNLTVLLRFGTSDVVFADLRGRLGWYQFNKSHKYDGASEWRALNTNNKIALLSCYSSF